MAELAPFVDFYKVASYELLVTDLLKACAQTGKPVVLSTGMATMDEIIKAAATLKDAGATRHHPAALRLGLSHACRRSQSVGHRPIREMTGLKTGWSDHTRRPAVIERAVHHWGARAVEFHLDLDGQGAEYAAGHCWLPQEIAPVIARIREAVVADGKGFKGPQPSELADREWRADPADGMRPLKHVRLSYRGEAA